MSKAPKIGACYCIARTIVFRQSTAAQAAV